MMQVNWWHEVKAILQYLKPYKGRVVAVAIFGMLMASLSVNQMLMLKNALTAIETNNFSDLEKFSLLILLTALASGISRFIHIFNMNLIAERVAQDMRLKLQAQFMNLSLSFHNQYEQGSGGLISRILNDIRIVQDGLRMVADLFRSPLQLVGLLGFLFYLDSFLTLIILVLLPIIALFLKIISQKIKLHSILAQISFERMTSTIKESLDGVRIIQSFGLEKILSQKLRFESDEYVNSRLKMHKRIEASGPVVEFTATFVIVGIMVYVAFRQSQGQASIGSMVTYMATLLGLNDPIKKFQESYVRMQETAVAHSRVREMVENVKVVSDAPGKLEFPKQWSKIRFNNVSFKFGEQYALREIDFEVHKGQKIAFVGASGSGKTTIINLLERFFEPFSGEVLLDNQNFNQFSLESLRQNISLVSQDSFLFNDTVENNIHFGDLKQSVSKVPAAAQAAYAEEFILKTPLQYKTLVGDRGGLFSGGEKQRLSIARAFFKDSAILILDEATSALDSQSEAEVQKGLERLMQGRTVFVVAHRLATVLDADLIFVLDQGSIVARGRHSELLINSPLYQKLFRMQQG